MAEEPAPEGTPPQQTPPETAQAPQPDTAPAPTAAPAETPAPVAAAPSAEATAAPAAVETPAAEISAAETMVAATPPSGDQPPTADDGLLDKDSIDALLKQANFDSPDANAAESSGGPSIEELLQQANFEDTAGGEVPGGAAEAFKLPSFQQVMADAQVSSIDLLRDVELNVKIELGRSRMLVEEVLQLTEGSVVELDKLAGDPVDVFVNDRLVARGEVLVLNDNFCVRVNEIVPAAQEEAM
jgi:flagellar motor switch protein FliN/FliY